MDVNQMVVICLDKIMVAFDRVLQELDSGHSLLDVPAFQKLVAYELMASRELLEFNYMFTSTTGHSYVMDVCAATRTHVEDVVVDVQAQQHYIVRVPLLEFVVFLLSNYRSRNHEDFLQHIFMRFPQHQCCWYSTCGKKACPSQAIALDSQRHKEYLFCHKHWSVVLKKDCVSSAGRMCPPAETRLDEWLDTIV